VNACKKVSKKSKKIMCLKIIGLSVNVLNKLTAKSGKYSARIHASSHNAL